MSVMERGEPGAVNTHWHSHINADRRFLCLGGQRPLSVENQAQDITFRPLLHYMYPTDQQIRLVDGFYSPVSATQPTFDAFVYDAAQSWAIMLQMTVSPSHSISIIGLDRLMNLGVRTIDLVAITDPKAEMDVYVANTHRDTIRHVYHLVLQGEDWRREFYRRQPTSGLPSVV